MARANGPIDQSDPSNLNVVFGRNDDGSFGTDTSIGAPEYSTVEGKVDRIPLNLPADGLISAGPESIRIDVVDIAEGAPWILGSIRPPSRDLKLAPLTISPAGIGEH